MGRKHRWRRRALLGLGTVGALLVVVLIAGTAWFAVAGRDFVWAKARPGEARLLAGETIPEQLAPAAWREDLDFLEREVPRRFGGPESMVDWGAFAADLEALGAHLETGGRDGILLGLMDAMALPSPHGTGHTGLFPVQRPVDWAVYPFRAYLFDDGLWVTLAGAGAERAQGAEILAIGGRPIAEVIDAAAPSVTADNEVGRKGRLATHLSLAGFLHGLGVTGDAGEVELSLRHEGDEPFTLTLEPIPLASLGGLRWARRLDEPVDDAWSPADPRPRRRNYRFDYRADRRLLHLRYNRVLDQPDGESLEDFAERLGHFVDAHPVERLVIDLRSNGGGNNQLNEPLVELISGHPVIDRRGVLYTLLGRRTYSAAGNLASALERRTKTLFVGEPGGFSPNHAGDAVAVPLPRSKVLVDVSSRLWRDGGPFDHRAWIAPDLPVAFEHHHHFEDRDPVLEAALVHRPQPRPEVPLPPDVLSALTGRYRFGPFHLLELSADAGQPRIEVRGVDTFLTSDLHPVAREERRVRFATDLSGVFLELDAAEGGLELHWHGEIHDLPAVEPGFRLPVDLLRDGRYEEGITAFRRLAAAGHRPDSRTELYLNALGYLLLRDDLPRDALEVFRLQAHLYPTVPNVFDSLGDGLRRAGHPEEAADAYRRALDLDPTFDHPRRMLAELGSGMAEPRP